MITRFGMNKKTLDPINSNLPFYVKQNGMYQPVKSLYVTGPSRSFYQADNSTYKYVWMETESQVWRNHEHPPMKHRIHISKENIISNMKTESNFPVCSVQYDLLFPRWCDAFEIHGPCQLRYQEDAEQEVWIETNSEITLIGERFDYVS